MDKFTSYVRGMGEDEKALVYAMIVLEVTDAKSLSAMTGLKGSRIKRTLKQMRDDLGVNSTVAVIAEFCRRGYHEKKLSEWGKTCKGDGIAGFCDEALG